MKYNRILLKLSGESLMGGQSYGISPEMLEQYVKDIKTVVEKKVQVSIVIGGGNIFRGLSGAAKGMDRVQGDYMGMLATLINSMALQAELEKQGVKTELLSGLAIEPICKEMSRRRAIEAMEEGKVVIIGGILLITAMVANYLMAETLRNQVDITKALEEYRLTSKEFTVDAQSYVVTGEEEQPEGCTGSCSSCSGCH